VRENPETADYRQLLAVDTAGRTAIHSGRRALGTVGGHQADGAAAAGNLLASAAVPRRMVEAWHDGGGQPTEARLLAALRAAMAAGGEAGPVHSAGLSVVALEVPARERDARQGQLFTRGSTGRPRPGTGRRLR
jgi:uncharacterized Ntn-hydrolase superfamily protein